MKITKISKNNINNNYHNNNINKRNCILNNRNELFLSNISKKQRLTKENFLYQNFSSFYSTKQQKNNLFHYFHPSTQTNNFYFTSKRFFTHENINEEISNEEFDFESELNYQSLPQYDLITEKYKSLVDELLKQNDDRNLNQLLTEYESKANSLDIRLYEPIFLHYLKNKTFFSAIFLFTRLEKMNAKILTIKIYNIVLNCLAKIKDTEKAEKIYQELKEKENIFPNLITINTMISIYSKQIENSNSEIKINELLVDLYNYFLIPSDKTYYNLLEYYTSLENWKRVDLIFNHFISSKIKSSNTIYFYKIRSLFKQKNLQELRTLLNTLANNRSINCKFLTDMITFFTREGDDESAVHVFQSFVINVTPDIILYTSIIPAYAKMGKFDSILQLTKSMKKHKVKGDGKFFYLCAKYLLEGEKEEFVKIIIKIAEENGVIIDFDKLVKDKKMNIEKNNLKKKEEENNNIINSDENAFESLRNFIQGNKKQKFSRDDEEYS